MSGAAGMIDYTHDLGAGKSMKVEGEGLNYVAVIKAPAGPLSFRFDDRAGIERYEGMGTSVPDFKKVVISSAVDQKVTVSVGRVEGGSPYDSRPVQFFGSIEVNTDVPDSNASLPDVTIAAGGLVSVVGVEPGRKTTLLQLDELAVGPVRYGDSAIGPARGLKLYPGDTLAIDGTAPLYVMNPNPSAVELHLLKQDR